LVDNLLGIFDDYIIIINCTHGVPCLSQKSINSLECCIKNAVVLISYFDLKHIFMLQCILGAIMHVLQHEPCHHCWDSYTDSWCLFQNVLSTMRLKKVSDLNKNADPLAISVHNPMFKCIKVM